MGVSKKCEITIDFIGFETPEEFETSEALIKALTEFFKKKKPDYKHDIDISIHEYNVAGDYVEFTMYSTRPQNLDWQVDLLEEFMADVGYRDYEITKDSWIQAEYP